MKQRFVYIIVGLIVVLICGVLLLMFLARKEIPDSITYGISFNTPYAHELGLDPDEVFDSFITDLGVRHFRLAAHWPLIEPDKDRFDFSWLDRQVRRVEEVGGTIILGVGHRLPRWPECHTPSWARDMSREELQEELKVYIEAVVERYRDSSAIVYWQVENEPYLSVFAREHCAPLDEPFFEEEIALVKSLDGTRPVLVTDSGNLGTWKDAYARGDLFGTSVYVYFWNPELGQFKSVLPPWFYRVKENLVALFYGDKQTLLIELSLEPWLVEPVTNVPIETQFERMDIEKFREIIAYAEATRFDTQYLWGGEWWYWLKEQGHEEMWEEGKLLFE